MTGMWFVLALIALAGACALLYFDRSRRDQTGRVRQIWAKAQGYTYDNVEEKLPGQFHRAALAKQEYLSAIDVVKGERRGGESFILFDLEETATIVAVRRRVARTSTSTCASSRPRRRRIRISNSSVPSGRESCSPPTSKSPAGSAISAWWRSPSRCRRM